MCEASTLAYITLALTTASTAYSIDAQNKMNDAAKEAAELTYDMQVEQNAQEAAANQSEVARQARAERSRILAAAAEAGIGGQVVLDQLQSSQFQQGFDIARIEFNRRQKDKYAAVARENQKAGIMTPNVWAGMRDIAQAGYQVTQARRTPSKNAEGKG